MLYMCIVCEMAPAVWWFWSIAGGTYGDSLSRNYNIEFCVSRSGGCGRGDKLLEVYFWGDLGFGPCCFDAVGMDSVSCLVLFFPCVVCAWFDYLFIWVYTRSCTLKRLRKQTHIHWGTNTHVSRYTYIPAHTRTERTHATKSNGGNE